MALGRITVRERIAPEITASLFANYRSSAAAGGLSYSESGAPGRNRTCCLAIRSRGQTISQSCLHVPTSRVQYQVLLSFCRLVATRRPSLPFGLRAGASPTVWQTAVKAVRVWLRF